MHLVHRKRSFAPFRVRGEIDMASAGECGTELWAYAATIEGDVVCDCTELRFLDSSGIAMFVELENELRSVRS